MSDSQETTSPPSTPAPLTCPWCLKEGFQGQQGLRIHQGRCPEKPSVSPKVAPDQVEKALKLVVQNNLAKLPDKVLEDLLKSVSMELLAYPILRWKGRDKTLQKTVARMRQMIESPTFVEDCWSVIQMIFGGPVDHPQRAKFQIVRLAAFEAIIMQGHALHNTQRRDLNGVTD